MLALAGESNPRYCAGDGSAIKVGAVGGVGSAKAWVDGAVVLWVGL